MRKPLVLAALAALAAASPVLADPPWARQPYDNGYDWHGDRGRHDGWRGDRGWHRERVMSRGDRVWYDRGSYRCRRSDGTTGTIVGAALGGLLGNSIAGRGDRTLGTIIGLAGGAAIGNSVDRGQVICR